MRSLDEALRPSVALLDVVIKNGDSEAKIIAEYAKADLFRGAAVALLSSVEAPPSLSDSAAVQYHAQVDEAFASTQPWRDQARESFREVARLGSEHPEVVSQNPVLAFAVNEAARTSVIATR